MGKKKPLRDLSGFRERLAVPVCMYVWKPSEASASTPCWRQRSRLSRYSIPGLRPESSRSAAARRLSRASHLPHAVRQSSEPPHHPSGGERLCPSPPRHPAPTSPPPPGHPTGAPPLVPATAGRRRRAGPGRAAGGPGLRFPRRLPDRRGAGWAEADGAGCMAHQADRVGVGGEGDGVNGKSGLAHGEAPDRDWKPPETFSSAGGGQDVENTGSAVRPASRCGPSCPQPIAARLNLAARMGT